MRILFFTPYIGQGGSDMMLLYLLEQLDPNETQAHVFYRRKGPMLSAPWERMPTCTFVRNHGLRSRIRHRLFPSSRSPYEKFLLRLHDRFRPDLWYLNTLTMQETVPLARELEVPYVVHAHELPFQYEPLDRQALEPMVQGARLAIGCSEQVCENLRVMGATNVKRLPECIRTEKIRPDPAKRSELRSSLGIGEKDFVWMMSGVANYRKGTDIMVDLARHLSGRGIRFVWLGQTAATGFQYFVDRQIKYYGLENVHFVPEQTDEYYSYLSCADGLVLTSREDPYPLVMLEAAALGKPIVSFDSGGAKEFVTEGMGVVVESPTVPVLAQALVDVMERRIPVSRDTLLRRAKEHDISARFPEWDGWIKEYFS